MTARRNADGPVNAGDWWRVVTLVAVVAGIGSVAYPLAVALVVLAVVGIVVAAIARGFRH